MSENKSKNNHLNANESSLVCVVLPSHNAQHHIIQSIESVLTQTHANLLLIVVDDGSTDKTSDVVTKFGNDDQRVVLLKLARKSGGPATPRNRALAYIQEHRDSFNHFDFVAFIDSDDVWHPQKLSYQIRIMNDYGLDFTSTLHNKFVGARAPITTRLDLPTSESIGCDLFSRINHERMLRKNKVVCSGVLVRSSVANRISFDEAPEYAGIEDYLAWLRVLAATNESGVDEIHAAIIQQPLVFYRVRRDSLSSSKPKMAKKIFFMLSNYSIDGRSLGIRKYLYFMYYIASGSTVTVVNMLKRYGLLS